MSKKCQKWLKSIKIHQKKTKNVYIMYYPPLFLRSFVDRMRHVPDSQIWWNFVQYGCMCENMPLFLVCFSQYTFRIKTPWPFRCCSYVPVVCKYCWNIYILKIHAKCYRSVHISLSYDKNSCLNAQPTVPVLKYQFQTKLTTPFKVANKKFFQNLHFLKFQNGTPFEKNLR